MSLAFIPGFLPNSPRFLGRFLSPVADGVAAHYVRINTRPGDIVFDPFGQSPSVAVEALSLDRRVVVASVNPILRLAVSMAVRPPALAELKTALTVLGDAQIGPGPGERLEAQIKSMYATACAECHTRAAADAFEWDAETGEPVEKHYVCLTCGGPRSAPTDEADRALAAHYGRNGPDYHFLLGRTADPDDADRLRADEVLAVYPPRTLAAIGMVVHKVETLDMGREARRLLAGLLVAAFDATTALVQERPKVLAVSRRYREVNFWYALEGAMGLLAGTPAPDRSASLDDLLANPGQAGIYAHAGPVREAAARLPDGGCALILSAPPRPNQAFWALSAAWAGWLWGRESVEALRTSLHRRRFDWTWHARALHQALAAARPTLAADGRMVSLLAEAEPGLNASLLAAAGGAGFDLQGWSLRADTTEAQLEFTPGSLAVEAPAYAGVAHTVREAAIELLRSRGEPSRWGGVHFAAWCRLAADGLIAWHADEPLALVNHALQEAMNDTSFQHLSETTGDDPSSGLWYLREPTPGSEVSFGRPLADRVETEVLRRLTAGEPVEEHDLLRDVYAAFPGALTPGRALVMACLASYATKDEAGLWRLRHEDSPTARSSELQSILAELRALAGRQGYDATANNPQEWRDAGQTVYIFAVLSSAVISRYLLGPQPPARRRFLVLPGGRAGLVEHKLRRDPRLRPALNAGDWTVVKFRQVRQMMADAGLTRATLEPALAGDPLEALRQMALPERGDQLL
jgi:hypothetical protein